MAHEMRNYDSMSLARIHPEVASDERATASG